jgi:hypothetical protein
MIAGCESLVVVYRETSSLHVGCERLAIFILLAIAEEIKLEEDDHHWIVPSNGGPVSRSAKRQKTVALSSCEAKYVAAAEATKEAIWMKAFINGTGF